MVEHIETKRCRNPDCSEKPISEFYFDKSKHTYQSECKECVKARSRKNYAKNPEQHKDVMKKWCENNRERSNSIKLAWKDSNPDYVYIPKDPVAKKKREKQWRVDNRGHINEYVRCKKKTDVNYKIRCNLRSRLSTFLKSGIKQGSAIKDLGCSLEELKTWLESKFYPNPDTGEQMTFDNYGDWHIDHKKPLSAFDLTDGDQIKMACHYTNLQPMWSKDNISKGGINRRNYGTC